MAETVIQTGQTPADEAAVERPKAPPIGSRFLYVDVAALRAKQLRRGAKMRLAPTHVDEASRLVKAERVAMEEVRSGLVEWSLPDFKAVFDIR